MLFALAGHRHQFYLRSYFFMIETLKAAVDKIEWKYVELSRQNYRNTTEYTDLGAPHWLERPFAYEIYHQLRILWNAGAAPRNCVIHAEVLKGYQHIKDINSMPDFLFHDPAPGGRSIAVVEIKLASNPKKEILADFMKLARFRKELRYEYLIEILIGSEHEIARSLDNIRGFHVDCDVPIHVLTLSITDHSARIFPIRCATL